MEKQNEIQKTEQATDIARIAPGSPAAIMMELARSSSDFDIEKFGKMLEFQERFEANEARKIYASDFADVQSKIEAVVKTEVNPQTRSKYAGLDGVIEMAKPVYTSQGFSIIYYEGETEVVDHIRVCADVLHKAGHKETYHYDVPLGGVGIQGKVNMTKIHAKATSVTYGRRYLLCMIWNIPTQDDDGNGADKKPPRPVMPTEENYKVLDLIIKKLELTVTKGRVIDSVALMSVFKNKSDYYPSDPNKVDAAVKYILELNEEDTWTVKRNFKDDLVDKSRTSDEVFEGYCKYHNVSEPYYIDRDIFNTLAEDCVAEPGDDLIAWAMKNIPLDSVIKEGPF